MTLSGEASSKLCLSVEELDNKTIKSKTSVKAKLLSEGTPVKKSQNLSSKKGIRPRSKTTEGTPYSDQNISTNKRPVSACTLHSDQSLKKNKSETCLIENTEMREEKKGNKPTTASGKHKTVEPETRQKLLTQKSPETLPHLLPNSEEGNSHGTRKTGKLNKFQNKKSSEIPKLKSMAKTNFKSNSKSLTMSSKLPVKSSTRESRRKQNASAERLKTASEKVKKFSKTEEKINHALKQDFNQLVPLYDEQLKKIADIWMNTVYCSYTMRSNLVKLLFQSFPYIDKSQFNTEDEKLLYCIDHAKNCTKLESQNLIQFVNSLVATHEKILKDYTVIVENKEIADNYNNDWKELMKKITELGDEIRQLQLETPKLQRKKEVIETIGDENIQKLELSLTKRDEEIKRLMQQYNILKQREDSFKGNVFLKVEDYKDIKADVESLKSVKKEYDEMKVNYDYQNDMYERKLKDLKVILEDKERALEKETKMKKQLQTILHQLQAKERHLTKLMGKEQYDFVTGRSVQERDKRREQLWITAVKLVLKGFFIQMKKLEKDRNKMLLELQLNDSENFKAIATAIIQKDNFIRSIKQQMKSYYNVSKGLQAKIAENACVEN